MSTPLDQLEALLAQQRLAQAQLGQALKAARTEQESGYLGAAITLPSPQWGSFAAIGLALLMCAAITAVVVAKVVRPKLQRLREQGAVERAKQEEMFVHFSLHGESANTGQTAAGRQKTDFRMQRRSAAPVRFSASGYSAASEATYMAPETAAVVDNMEIDFDLDLSSYDQQPAALDARWQTQFDQAKNFSSMGQLQEAALIYAELVAHGDAEVAQRADALLSALPQSR